MRFLCSLFFAPVLFAAPITNPVLTLSNLQSSSQLSIDPDYGMFFGFTFSDPLYDPNDASHIYIPLGGGARLGSNPVTAQSIHAEASADFAVPGYRVTSIMLLGQVAGDGSGVLQQYGISSPCSAFVDSGGYGRICTLPEGGVVSGAFTATLDMRSDLKATFQLPGEGSGYIPDLGTVTNPRLMLTVIHNPEPVTMLLIATGLIGIGVIGRKRVNL